MLYNVYNNWLKQHAGKNLEKAYNKLRDKVLHRRDRMKNYMPETSQLFRRLEGIIDKGEIPTWKQAGSMAERNRAIAQMLRFQEAKSTTKKGYTALMQKREKMLQDKFEGYGADAARTSDAIDNLVFSGLLNRFVDSKMLTSDQVMKMWANASKDDKNIKAAIKALEEFESEELTAREAQEIMSEGYRMIMSGGAIK